MNDYLLNQYMTILFVMAIITIGIILYAIIKSDFSKRTFRLIKAMFFIDVIILTYFLIKLWSF